MSEDKMKDTLDVLVQMVELAKKAGIEEIPMKTDAILEFVDAFKELEKIYDQDIQAAKHEGWVRGVRDMARNALSSDPKKPISPFKEASE